MWEMFSATARLVGVRLRVLPQPGLETPSAGGMQHAVSMWLGAGLQIIALRSKLLIPTTRRKSRAEKVLEADILQ